MDTNFDAQGIRNAATNIGRLLDDMSAFTALKPHWPNAGHFDLAVWLERIVDDRRNALVTHVDHLKIAFEDLQTTMFTVADGFENADGENADRIKAVLTELQTKITGDIATLDKNTEASQHNFTANPASKPGDGDGWNDNLNDPV